MSDALGSPKAIGWEAHRLAQSSRTTIKQPRQLMIRGGRRRGRTVSTQGSFTGHDRGASTITTNTNTTQATAGKEGGSKKAWEERAALSKTKAASLPVAARSAGRPCLLAHGSQSFSPTNRKGAEAGGAEGEACRLRARWSRPSSPTCPMADSVWKAGGDRVAVG
jgi:hypothetical protein